MVARTHRNSVNVWLRTESLQWMILYCHIIGIGNNRWRCGLLYMCRNTAIVVTRTWNTLNEIANLNELTPSWTVIFKKKTHRDYFRQSPSRSRSIWRTANATDSREGPDIVMIVELGRSETHVTFTLWISKSLTLKQPSCRSVQISGAHKVGGKSTAGLHFDISILFCVQLWVLGSNQKEHLKNGGYTRVDTPTQIRRTTHGYVLRHTKTFK